ncbi:MAG: MogA/MoaB family molybdenum cofactor biosynthesis protein, partial [Candidatus Acidiferrales bacterium]
MRVAIVTVSDSVAQSKREDRSGPAVCERCEKLGWTVSDTKIVADDEAAIRKAISDLADSGKVDLILTAGGTGIGPRDVTPEATTAVVSKLIPGLADFMRSAGQRS